MKLIKKWKKDLFFCLLLVVIVFAFLNRGATMQGVFFGADEIASDLLHFSYPYHEYFATDFLKKGQIPLWNPYVGSGLPLLAEAQTGIFYPISAVLYYLLSVAVAFNWLIISSFLILAFGTYFYSREIGFSPWIAFFSATVFSLSGFMVGHLRHVPIITAIAFMPWMFLAIEGILDKSRNYWALFLSLFIALSFFAGHLTTTYLILLAIIVYFFLRLGKVFEKRSSESMRPIFLFGGVLILGIVLSAVQLLPTLELVPYSTRDNALGGMVSGVAFVWKYLLLFLNPYILGDPSRATWDINRENFWENLGYLGIVPLVLCIISLFLLRDKKSQYLPALKASFVLSFILTLGTLTPFYKMFLEIIPGASFTRNPGRFLLFVDFFGSILAGFGLMLLESKIKNVLKRNLVIFFLVVLSVFDLFYFGYPFNTVIPVSYFSEPASAAFLKKDNELFRIKADVRGDWREAWRKARGWRGDRAPYMAQKEGIPPDLNLSYRLSSPMIIYSLAGHFSVKRSGELEALVFNTASEEGRQTLSKLLGMENVKYILVSEDLRQLPGLKLVKTINTNDPDFKVYIYENQKFLPRAYLVGKALSFSNSDELLDKMLFGSFEPQKEVLLEEKINPQQVLGSGKTEIKNYRPEKIEIEVNSEKGGFLVLSDTFYPGWKAFVDGRETKIYRANYAYRMVKVGPGNKNVVFSYDPLYYKIGKYVSLFSFGAVFILITLSFIKNAKKSA